MESAKLAMKPAVLIVLLCLTSRSSAGILFRLTFEKCKDAGGEVAIEADVAARPVSAKTRGVQIVDGLRGNGLRAHSENAKISFPTAGNLDPKEGTLIMWLRPEWRPANPYSLPFMTSGAGGNFIIFKNTRSYKMMFTFSRARRAWTYGGVHRGNDVSKWEDGTWHQLALTWKAGAWVLFLDGERVGWGSGLDRTIGGEMFIGASGGYLVARATIDEVIIFDSALDQSSLKALAEAAMAKDPNEFENAIRNPAKVPTFEAKLIPPDVVGGEARAELNLTNGNMDALDAEFRWEVVDFFQNKLAGTGEKLSLQPGTLKRTAAFSTRGRRLIRLTVYYADGEGKPKELTRYYESLGVQGIRNSFRLPWRSKWERLLLPKGQEPSYPPMGKWKKVEAASGQKDHLWAWFRKRFTAPTWLRAERYRLDFLRVNFQCRVYLNGKEVGSHGVGHAPFSIDVTDAFKPDAENVLLLCIGSIETTKRDPKWNPNIPGRYYQNDYLTPPAANFHLWGMMEDAWLVAHAASHIEDVFVQPSVRRKELVVDVTLRNDGQAPAEFVLRSRVEDRDEPALELPAQHATLSPGELRTVRMAAKWDAPKLWWPWSPHLYRLRTSLGPADGAAPGADEVSTRFGFREIRIDGIFYTLNGRRMKMRTGTAGASWGALHERRGTREWLVQRRGSTGPVLYVRTHLFPSELHFLDVADELGILVKHEAAIWSTVFNPLEDRRFWENCATHLSAYVKSRRNRPSLIAWSLENEVLIASNLCPDLYKSNIDHLKELGHLVKKLDPTRPVEFEGDADLDGAWETYNLHYPRWWFLWSHFPEDAYWLGKTADQKCDQSWPPRVRWRRDKPMILGELGGFGKIIRPHDLTLVLGDDAYRGDISYSSPHLRAADDEMFALMIEGYRDSEAGLICPDLGGSGGPHMDRSLLPVRLFVRERDRRFFGGDRVERRVNIHHDLLESGRLRFAWRLKARGETLERGGLQFDAKPGELRRAQITFRLPEVEKPLIVSLPIELYRNNELVFTETKSYEVVPKEPVRLPKGCKIGLWPARGATAELFDRLDIPYRRFYTVEDPETAFFLKDLSAVVIGRDYLADARKNYPSMESALSKFVARGGKVICLQQERFVQWPEGAQLRPSDRAVSYAWRRAPDHPILNGFTDEQLRYWRGDHAVARYDFVKPSRGNFIPIIDAGGRGGLRWAPVIEIPHGKGCYLLSQLCLTEKAESDPTARKLLANLLAYASLPTYRQVSPAALCSADQTLRKALDEMGVVYEMTSRPSDIHHVAIVDAKTSLADRTDLAAFARNGGTMLLKDLGPNETDAWSVALGGQLVLKPIETGRLLKTSYDPLLAGVSHTELCTTAARHVRTPEGPPLAKFSVTAEHASPFVKALLDPPALVVVDVGKGRVVIDQVLWDSPPAGHGDVSDREIREKARRYGAILLTNLGVQMRW